MKALTLHQPWATHVAEGRKPIETRSWTTKYRGPLAIHAGMNTEHLAYLGWLEDHLGDPDPVLDAVRDRIIFGERNNGTVCLDRADLPFGAIVATCNLVDVVPMVRWDDADHDHEDFLDLVIGDAWQVEELTLFRGRMSTDDLTDQLPFGQYAPGRYAWLLEDVKATTEQCPACTGKGWHDLGRYGPGSSTEPAGCLVCAAHPTRACPPVAAKGRQGLWEWNP